MFESAELGHKMSKDDYRAALPALRLALQEAQVAVYEAKIPVVLLISGQDGAGKGEIIHSLYEWLDPRFINTLAFSDPTDEERERPAMWRYWRSLPPKGRIGIFAGSWYSKVISEQINGDLPLQNMDAQADQINRFEAMLVNEGTLVLKVWLHLTEEAQRARLKKLEDDPKTAWRVTKWHWNRLKTLDKLHDTARHLLRMTNTPRSPWVVVDGADDRYRTLTIGQTLLTALQQRLAQGANTSPPATPIARADVDGRNVLSEMDLTLKLSEKQYKTELAHWQGRLNELINSPKFKGRSVVCAFEGADAAGKGGAIRRVGAAMDARQYQVFPVAAPTEEERAQPYLWRFWRNIPRQGRVSIFDRTWYGRVLVERVEGFCKPDEWLRAYTEINDFEHELSEAGCIVVKFWLQISQEEQLRRFKEREKIAFKRFKITEEDWRNRKKWADYQQAVCEMVERTSTGEAPWTLVEANDKAYARVKIIRTLCERIEAEFAGTADTSKNDKPAKAGKSAKSVKTPKITAKTD